MDDFYEQEAIAFLQSRGYRVSKPHKATRAANGKPLHGQCERCQHWGDDCTCPKLNALGKPFGAGYSPNYKMKHKTSMAHLFKSSRRNLPMVSDQQCDAMIERWRETGKWVR